MNWDNLSKPNCSGIVELWLDSLYDGTPSRQLWEMLDSPLRLALVQAWLLNTQGEANDALAGQLSPVHDIHPLSDVMLADHRVMWKSVYQTLQGGYGILDKSEIVGVDMELVFALSREYIGPTQPNVAVPAHSFIARLVEGRWLIAALARRLPVPGWPPTEQILPGFGPVEG